MPDLQDLGLVVAAFKLARAGYAVRQGNAVKVLLVERDPPFDLGCQRVDNHLGELHESVHHVLGGKALVTLGKRERHVEVVKAGHGLDAPGDKVVRQGLVIRQALLVDRALALRHDARPGGLEAVAVHAHPGHELIVLAEAVVAVDGLLPSPLVVLVDARTLAPLVLGPVVLHAGNRVPPEKALG